MITRTSRRAIATAVKAATPDPEDTLVASEDEFIADPEDGDRSWDKKPRGKKRKAVPKATQAFQSSPKRQKRIRGQLKDLVEMPIDVLFEIFAQLDPLDLIHLARSSKDLRAMLMSRTSAPIWRSARSNFLPPIPDCPEDLSEPVYAELLFEKSCHFCSRRCTTHHGWSSRIRICMKCIHEHCVLLRNVTRGLSGAWHRIRFSRMEVPCISIHVKDARYIKERKYIFRTLYRTWRTEYEELDTEAKQKEWVENLCKEQEKVAKHANRCRIWLREYQVSQEAEVLNLAEKQQALVAEYVDSLGWANVLSTIPPSDKKFHELPEIQKLCRKKFTSRNPKIDSFIQDVQKRRSNLIARECLSSLLPPLMVAHTQHMASIDDASRNPYPTAGELLIFSTILDVLGERNMISANGICFLTPEDLKPIVSLVFPDATEQLRKRFNGPLIGRLRSAFPTQNMTEESGTLHLATTIFTCACSGRTFWYEDFIKHSCEGSRGYIPHFDANEDPRICLEKYGRDLHNRTHLAAVDVTAAQVLHDIVITCGLDPLTTTKQVMDAADPIFECKGCNSQQRGRTTMTWSTVLSHIRNCHAGDAAGTLGLELLTGREADTARKRIAEQYSRACAANDPCVVACGHCGGYRDAYGVYNRMELIGHIKRSHGIVHVTDKDFIPRPDCKTEDWSVFHMWPPRPVVR